MARFQAVLCALLSVVISAFAIPQLINYQGQLTSPSGTPLDSTVAMSFALYDSVSGGTAVWTEAHPSVIVADGLFSVQLGSITTLPDVFAVNRWLGVTVGGDAELSPREQLISVAYAYRVGTVDSASGGAITGNITADSVITGGVRFGDGSVQTSAVTGIEAYQLDADTNTFDATRTWVQSMGYLKGANNEVSSTGFVGGGDYNKARGSHSFIGGGGGTSAPDSNSASGFCTVVSGGRYNHATGNFATVGGGISNDATSGNATVAGGYSNDATGYCATAGGGYSNQPAGNFSTVGGGYDNAATDSAGVVSGGRYNAARGRYSVVGGGGGPSTLDSNSAIGINSVVSGGRSNLAWEDYSAVGGGRYNATSGTHSAVGGGYNNQATGSLSIVGGGSSNEAAGVYSAVGGGYSNIVTDSAGIVCGGRNNKAHGKYSFVGGGGGASFADSNSAQGQNSVIVGGRSNLTTGSYSVVGGGYYNKARGAYSAILGGGSSTAADSNSATGDHAVILGGAKNSATDSYSVCGGYNVVNNGDYSFAFGRDLTMNSDFAFAFSDGSEVFTTSVDNTATFLTTGGFRIWTANPSSSNIGTRLTAGGSSWVALCDSTTKENRRDANGADVLQRISAMPIDRWNYKHQDETTEHIGPMAQDFWNAFHLGSDSLGIETIDADGVLFAAIQELAKQNQILSSENAKQASDIAELKQLVQQLVQLGINKNSNTLDNLK